MSCPESNRRKSWWLSGERPLQTMHYESKNGTWRVFGLVIGKLRHLEPSLSHSWSSAEKLVPRTLKSRKNRSPFLVLPITPIV